MREGDITYTATITRLERLRNSRNGNPRYRLHYADRDPAVTESDTHIALGLTDRIVGIPVTITATPSGRVYDIQSNAE